MISQPFVLLRKWILSMIGVGQAAGTPTDKSESDCFESETHIGANRCPISGFVLCHWCSIPSNDKMVSFHRETTEFNLSKMSQEPTHCLFRAQSPFLISKIIYDSHGTLSRWVFAIHIRNRSFETKFDYFSL